MEITEVRIIGTKEQIADGLTRFIELNAPHKPEPTFQDEKLTVQEAADFSRISYKTLCTRIKSGKIRIHGSGRTRFLLKSELIDDLTL